MASLYSIGKDKARQFRILSGVVFKESERPKEKKSAPVDLPMPYLSKNTTLHPGGFALESVRRSAWTSWFGEFKSVSKVRVANLKSCVGLVIAAISTEKKGGSVVFDDVIAFHLGGVGSESDRTCATQAWGVVLDGVPGTIRSVVKEWNYPSNLYVAAVAGPHHPGTSKEFEADYGVLVAPLKQSLQKTEIKSEFLFWTGDKKNPLKPEVKAQAIMELTNTGDGLVWQQSAG